MTYHQNHHTLKMIFPWFSFAQQRVRSPRCHSCRLLLYVPILDGEIYWWKWVAVRVVTFKVFDSWTPLEDLQYTCRLASTFPHSGKSTAEAAEAWVRQQVPVVPSSKSEAKAAVASQNPKKWELQDSASGQQHPTTRNLYCLVPHSSTCKLTRFSTGVMTDCLQNERSGRSELIRASQMYRTGRCLRRKPVGV